MNIFQAIFLGALQGITEFLPISSSGHLVLFEEFFKINAQNLISFDIVLHLGTLISILIFFRKDLIEIIKNVFNFIFGKIKWKDSPDLMLVVYIVLATIPAVVVGFIFKDYIELTFRNIKTVSIMFIILSLFFLVSEFIYRKNYKKSNNLTIWKVLFIGVMQSIALIPGISRSGSTISAGIITGIDREKSARFSFLLAIPVILGAGIIIGLKDLVSGDVTNVSISPYFYLIGFLSSFIFGYLSVSFLMKFLKTRSLLLFSAYLFIVGVSLFSYYSFF